jgi:hypothetical protein
MQNFQTFLLYLRLTSEDGNTYYNDDECTRASKLQEDRTLGVATRQPGEHCE